MHQNILRTLCEYTAFLLKEARYDTLDSVRRTIPLILTQLLKVRDIIK